MDSREQLGKFVYLDGEIVPTEKACVSVLDRGLLRGEGVFETIRSYGRTLFALRRHVERMVKSARATGIRLPPTDVLRGAISACNDANRYENARFQLTVTGGAGGPAPDPVGEPEPTTLVIAAPIPPRSDSAAVSAVTLPWVRHEGAALTGVKPTSYLDHLVGHKWAHAQGADEGLWRNSAGELTEATGSNLFIVRDGVVITPPVEAGLLPGVTRDLVLDRCVERGVPTDERVLPVEDVLDADECFLTSTTKEAVAVGSVDATPIGRGDYTVLAGILADWHVWALEHPDP